MDSLNELIYTIAQRPELYLGKPSVQRLYAYIGGFLHRNDVEDSSCLDGFTEYIASIYHIKSSHNWASILDFFSTNEAEGFSLFMKHYEDYQKMQTNCK